MPVLLPEGPSAPRLRRPYGRFSGFPSSQANGRARDGVRSLTPAKGRTTVDRDERKPNLRPRPTSAVVAVAPRAGPAARVDFGYRRLFGRGLAPDPQRPGGPPAERNERPRDPCGGAHRGPHRDPPGGQPAPGRGHPRQGHSEQRGPRRVHESHLGDVPRYPGDQLDGPERRHSPGIAPGRQRGGNRPRRPQAQDSRRHPGCGGTRGKLQGYGAIHARTGRTRFRHLCALGGPSGRLPEHCLPHPTLGRGRLSAGTGRPLHGHDIGCRRAGFRR
jgi:hypothetical protein